MSFIVIFMFGYVVGSIAMLLVIGFVRASRAHRAERRRLNW